MAVRVAKVRGAVCLTDLYTVLHFFPADDTVPGTLGVTWVGDGGWDNAILYADRLRPPAPVPYAPVAAAYGWTTDRYFLSRVLATFAWASRAGGPSLTDMGVTRSDLNRYGVPPGRAPRPRDDAVTWKLLL